MPQETRRERKVVTVLFCDLVGFTSRAEEMDPEDVAAVLAPYHARLREELERYGGTVEKFIGDAVMALFGAPTAHEDDPERAVRAALAIRDFAEHEGIELRVGITTGEALVTLGARPEAGETMATGDVGNTAARIQAAAPVNGVLVSQKTCDATKHAIDYADAEPVEAKGKARPVLVSEAIRAAPLQERTHTTPLVGREEELEQLRAALVRMRDERKAQLVTVVGPPGIGKSRLVYELSQPNGSLSWRKGRCLPYGDGVTFWALGEIVKVQVGILESDSPEQAEAKLVAAVDDSWVVAHLRPLVGAGEGRETLGDRRAEAFGAWRRFLTTLAEEQPLALVLEDIHWADDGLLDFVAHLLEWAQESQLLLLCTARPELLERRPGWGANDPRALTIPLSPLSDEQTGRLLSALVVGEASDELVARAAGNPLYAEQYARLVVEGGSLEEPPESVQGIIAARLDGLPAEEKALVQDAAVIGRVFWRGAVAALGGDDRWSVEERLLALERRELVRRERGSSVEGEMQYAFRHILLRDVAYAELPRAERADKHVRAATWIDSLGRSEDHTELLAHHYVAAIEYARAAGRETVELSERARLALRAAGERALGLGAFTAAVRHYRAALELWPADDAERPYLLLPYGRALRWAEDRGENELAEGRDLLIAAGDPGTAAEADLLLADIAVNRGHLQRASEHLDQASALVGDVEASRSKAYVLGHLARFRMMRGSYEDALQLGQQALRIADEMGLDELRPHVLNTVGLARVHCDDPAGVADLERSVELALDLNAVPDILRGYNNLAAAFGLQGDLRRSHDALEDGLRAAERFGEWVPAQAVRANLTVPLYELGDWDEALRIAEEFITEVESGEPSVHVAGPLETRAEIRLARDDIGGALADARARVEHERQTASPFALAWSLSLLARVLLQAGSRDEGERVAEEFLATLRADADPVTDSAGALMLSELGRGKDALALLERVSRTRWRDAAQLVLSGRLAEAADVYAAMGYLSREASVRLKAAELLIEHGRRAEADEQLQRALAFYRSVGATRYVREAEALLAVAG